MPRSEKRPDYDALDDIGFIGWGKLTPIGEIEIPKRIQNLQREQAAKNAVVATTKGKRRKAVPRGQAKNSR